MNSQIDIRHVLPSIRVPTLVLHRTGELDSQPEEGRYIGERIPNARFVELGRRRARPGSVDPDQVLDEIEEFVTEASGSIRRRPRAGDGPLHGHRRLDRASRRDLATVAWRDAARAASHARPTGARPISGPGGGHGRRRVSRHVRRAGASNPLRRLGPRCGLARSGSRSASACTRASASSPGLGVRGIAVHTGARVAAIAGPGEVLVSSTVKDLVAGSGLEFEDRGSHELKGVPGEWRLYAVANA